MYININSIIETAFKMPASDLHLTPGLPPMARLFGEIVAVPPGANEEDDKDLNWYQKLSVKDIVSVAEKLMNEREKAFFEKKGEVDFSYTTSDNIRVRVNVYKQRKETSIAMRIIPGQVPDLLDLGVPPALFEMLRRRKGLLLITGPTGMGKTTTLASMVDYLNNLRNAHIITLEDPIEYIHDHIKSIVTQREIGSDSESFGVALRAALRQDPDIILLGEMRDLDTIATAITAAETGHLVLATLHTVDAPQTIDRIIDVFPPHQQTQIKVQLANTLIGVIAQKLLPHKNGKEFVLATEVLKTNMAVRNLIREGKVHQIYSVIQTSSKEGMYLMDASLRRLYRDNLIDYQTAIDNASSSEIIIC